MNIYSSILDEQHLYSALRYVENNPVRAGIVEKADEYTWSSARAHIYHQDNMILTKDCYLLKTIPNWSEYLTEKDDESVINNIRHNTKTGRPCGDKSFICAIEGLLGRTLTKQPRGRPRMEK